MDNNNLNGKSNGHSNGNDKGAGKVIGMPQPEAQKATPPVASGPVTFKDFAFQIKANEMVAAASSLIFLFDCSAMDATTAAEHFRTAVEKEPAIMFKTMELKAAVEAGKINPFSALLHECFGLSGPIAIQIFQHLTKTLAKS